MKFWTLNHFLKLNKTKQNENILFCCGSFSFSLASSSSKFIVKFLIKKIQFFSKKVKKWRTWSSATIASFLSLQPWPSSTSRYHYRFLGIHAQVASFVCCCCFVPILLKPWISLNNTLWKSSRTFHFTIL